MSSGELLMILEREGLAYYASHPLSSHVAVGLLSTERIKSFGVYSPHTSKSVFPVRFPPIERIKSFGSHPSHPVIVDSAATHTKERSLLC